jgi:phage terminase small subunit
MAMYAPRGLSAEAHRLFRETVTQNALDQIDDAASLTLLENACRALMRLRAAEAVIAKEGQTVMDRFGQLKPHPMAARIDAEGQTIRQSLGAIRNHQAAAFYKREQLRRNGAEADPWGREGARQDAI